MSDKDDGAPVMIDLSEEDTAPSPAEARPIPDDGSLPRGEAMQAVTRIASGRASPLVAWFWRLLIAIIAFAVSLTVWDTVTGLMSRNQIVGTAALVLLAAFAFVCLALSIREVAALSRLGRVERLQAEANRVLAEDDTAGARAFLTQITRFYGRREDLRWGRERLAERSGEIFDAKSGLAEVEATLLAPLDAEASREVESAARQVATVTALVPLALADVLVALTANLRMIRRVAEVYGGRSGTFGAWRLMRAVAAHLVATGAVAVGDDLIGSVGGGHILGKLSRRFGEGLVNGALTARVGVAAIEVCRPMPFLHTEKPRVTSLVRRALTGLFGTPNG